MHPTQRTAIHQQKIVKNQVVKTDSNTFFDLLSEPELLNQIDSSLPPYRKRIFSPMETLSMFLAQAMNADRSCQNVVNEMAIKRLITGLPISSTHTGAYCRARKRLPTQMIASLTRHTGKMMSERTESSWNWKGRPVKLVDGTMITLPDTAANQGLYPQPNSQRAGLGFPLCRLVGVICLATGALLDTAMGACKGKGSDEQSLLRSILNTVGTGDILLGDVPITPLIFYYIRYRKKGPTVYLNSKAHDGVALTFVVELN